MFLKSGLILFSVIIFSCGTVQNSSQTMETNKAAELEAQKVEAKKMLAEGFLPGKIVYSDLVDDCEYTIQLKNEKQGFYYVDPINLDKKFSTDEQTVWVKLTWLRRMNRCEKAVPVEINEIKNRAE